MAFTFTKARKIRDEYREDTSQSFNVLAEKYGCSAATVARMIRGEGRYESLRDLAPDLDGPPRSLTDSDVRKARFYYYVNEDSLVNIGRKFKASPNTAKAAIQGTGAYRGIPFRTKSWHTEAIEAAFADQTAQIGYNAAVDLFPDVYDADYIEEAPTPTPEILFDVVEEILSTPGARRSPRKLRLVADLLEAYQ